MARLRQQTKTRMRIKFWKYDYQDGRKVVLLLEALQYAGVSIIGGLQRRGHSNNDIDIYLSKTEYSNVEKHILLGIFQTNKYKITDWGSLYLPDTLFGTLDIFFKGQTDEFDY